MNDHNSQLRDALAVVSGRMPPHRLTVRAAKNLGVKLQDGFTPEEWRAVLQRAEEIVFGAITCCPNWHGN